jgi:hypothetical protein
MVQLKSTTVALVAAALIAPAVASSYYYAEDGLVAREDFDEYNDVLARDYDYDLEVREYVDELFEREFGASELLERELDDLFERDPLFGYHHLKKWWANRKAKKQAKKDAQLAAQQPGDSLDASTSFDATAREFDDEMEIDARGFDDEMEFEARAPEAEYEQLLQRYFDDLYERELTADAEAEIAARELESEEFDLFQRSPEPGFVEWIKNLFHPKKKQDQKKKEADSKKADSSDSKAASSSDSKKADSSADSSVDARGYYEDFDELD